MSELNIKVYSDLMGANRKWADKTRDLLKKTNTALINLIGSPGAGKTALLESTFKALQGRYKFAVLEGDVETTYDSQRLARLNCPVSQLLSGGSCHLEAKLVHYALKDLSLDELDMVVVENVGNLVCPAEFDIGEHAKVAVLSITEGEDKPAKYPLLFREARAVVLTKLDLAPHLSFDLKSCLSFIKGVNSEIPVMQVSAKTGHGMEPWLEWFTGLGCKG